jgi:hypothetical protein
MSDKTKEKMRQSKLGKKQSPEQIEKTRQRMIEYWASKKGKKNIVNNKNEVSGCERMA